MSELSTTSYAILCLLAVKPWTTYELAQQMGRSLRDVWPRAESVIYEEPKRLVKAGLASADKQYTGRRASTVYKITAKGRRALRTWLDTPGGGPSTEFEAMLQVAFADHGSIDQLRANVEAISDMAERRRQEVEARFDEYAESGGPFPERLPVIALAARFQLEQVEALRRWAAWAQEAISDWSGVRPDDGAHVPDGAFSAEAWAGAAPSRPANVRPGTRRRRG